MPSTKEEEVIRLIRVGLIERRVEKWTEAYQLEHGGMPTPKDQRAERRVVDTDPSVDRQVGEIWTAAKKVAALEEQGPLWARLVGVGFLLAVVASLIGALFLERFRIALPGIVTLCLSAGFALVFYKQTQIFVKRHRRISGLIGGLVVVVAVLLSLVFAPYMSQTVAVLPQ